MQHSPTPDMYRPLRGYAHLYVHINVPTPTHMSAVICIYKYICLHVYLTLYTPTPKVPSVTTQTLLFPKAKNQSLTYYLRTAEEKT